MSHDAIDAGGEFKRLMLFVGHYPSPYKPYYDTQIVDLLRSGYDVQIVAAPALDATVHEKVIAHGLLARTHYYPVDLRSGGITALVRPLAQPLRSARFLATSNGGSFRRKAGDLVRMASLPKQRPDAILVHGLGVALTFEWLGSWYPKVPKALYYHGGEVPSTGTHDDRRAARAFEMFDVVFTNTEFSRGQAIKRGCPAEKVIALPVGFDVAEYCPPLNRSYRKDGALRLLSLGRMSAEKGLEFAIEALHQVIASGRPNVTLSFAGDGYLRPELEKQAAILGLGAHVRFLGALTSNQVAAELANTDALILPSYAHGNCIETQACAVQEAMLMKALVVTTTTGGVPESIPEAMRPFSVPERDASALARAIISIYDMAESDMAALAAKGRTFVQERYDINSLNNRLLMELAQCSRRS